MKTEKALINDVLETGLNQVAIKVEGKKKQFYDLVSKDDFWMKYRFCPALPDVAEAVGTELAECQKQEDEVKNLKVSFLIIRSKNLKFLDQLQATYKPCKVFKTPNHKNLIFTYAKHQESVEILKLLKLAMDEQKLRG